MRLLNHTDFRFFDPMTVSKMVFDTLKQGPRTSSEASESQAIKSVPDLKQQAFEKQTAEAKGQGEKVMDSVPEEGKQHKGEKGEKERKLTPLKVLIENNKKRFKHAETYEVELKNVHLALQGMTLKRMIDLISFVKRHGNLQKNEEISNFLYGREGEDDYHRVRSYETRIFEAGLNSSLPEGVTAGKRHIAKLKDNGKLGWTTVCFLVAFTKKYKAVQLKDHFKDLPDSYKKQWRKFSGMTKGKIVEESDASSKNEEKNENEEAPKKNKENKQEPVLDMFKGGL